MLHRSASSRRRRASRSVTGSSQSQSSSAQQQPQPRSRRASLASTEPATEALRVAMDRQRSPRGSCVPNIALDPEDETHEEMWSRRLLPDPEHCGASRLSLAPDDYGATASRSPRGSLVPEVGAGRSPRNSLVPEMSRSPRHSLVPLDSSSVVPPPGYKRSASRASLMPERSPRHSLVPDCPAGRSPRGSLANIDSERSPRGSLCALAEGSRSPRGSIAPLEPKERSPRGSIASECLNQSPRGSICPEVGAGRSPRGSSAGHRGSLGGAEDDASIVAGRSPRGSIGPTSELERSPRGSIAGRTRPPNTDPRRPSHDQVAPKSGNATGSYRQREDNSGSVRSAGSAVAAQVNLAYTWSDSRRPSSSVSQFSGDESRRLCEGPRGGTTASGMEKAVGGSGGTPMGVAAYGSLVFQLKDAHLEANGTCDFVLRALRVVSKTTPVTVSLAFLSTMPIVMLILGVQFIRDCPREPNIPVYMVVGGALGSIRMFWTLYSQIRSRRPEVLTVPGTRSHLSPTKLASFALSAFLLGWFALGNYWILSIRWPDYAPTLFEPNRWCHKTLYIFSLVHLFIVYVVIVVSALTGLGLLFCRILACPWPERYK